MISCLGMVITAIMTTKLDTPTIGAVMRLSTKRVFIGLIALVVPFIPASHASAMPSGPHFAAKANFVPVKVWTRWHLSPKEFGCLNQLVILESHWNAYAKNPRSGAYGIFQFMPQTWGNYRVVKTSDPYKQVSYGLRYIKVRYGSECQALNFHYAKGWF